MSLLGKVRDLGLQIPKPVRSAAKLVLGTFLPGAPTVVELIADTIEWANKGPETPAPPTLSNDSEKVEKVLGVLTKDLKDLTSFVSKLEDKREGQAGGYVLAQLAHSSELPRTLHDLDSLAKAFARLEQHNRRLLESQQFAGQKLEELQSFMRRLVGLSDFVDELRDARLPQREFDVQLSQFGQGAQFLASGKLDAAETCFRSLTSSRPQSPAAAIGLGTSQATCLGANDPHTEKIIRKVADWAAIQDDKKQPFARTGQQLQELKLVKRSDVTDAWLAYNLYGMNGLKTLHVWYCQVTNDGLDVIGNLSNLATLSIKGCPHITDADVKHICKLSNLKKLTLWDTQITKHGIEQLHHSLPNLKQLYVK